MGFLIKKIICILFGHKWENSPSNASLDPISEFWRPAQYCPRCGKTQ